MSKDILNNLNPGIEDLHPYEPGRSIDEVIKEYGHKAVSYTHLTLPTKRIV